LALQLGRLGLGVTFSDTSIVECNSEATDCLTLGQGDEGTTTTIRTARLAVGYAFLDGDLVAGASAFVPSVVFDISGDSSASPNVTGGTIELGVLYRPAGERYRVGAVWRPRSRSDLDVAGAGQVIAGRVVPEQLLSPWVLGIGGAYAFGTRPMNLTPTFGDSALHGDRYDSFARGHYQVSADLILIGSESSAVGLDGWFEQEAQASGRDLGLAVRLGLEGEVIPDLLIARLGSYLEPSRFAETSSRLHGTGGLDLRLFEFIWVWRAGVAFDFSRDFDQITLSAGFWH
ncbi:MAG: hypothetical protein AAF658_00100, partial [Myxococcota bacterium]